MKPHPTIYEPSEKQIQRAAYYLWQEEGRPTDRDLEIWLTAKVLLRHGAPAIPDDLDLPRNAPRRARSAQGVRKRYR